MPDNLVSQSLTPATIPDATAIGAAQGSFSGDTVYLGIGLVAKSSGAEGARVFTLIGPAEKVALSVTALQVTASGDTTLVASGTRKLLRVEASNSHASTAVVVGLKVSTLNSGAVFGKRYLTAAGGQTTWDFSTNYLPITAEAIVANLSATGTVEMTAYYE